MFSATRVLVAGGIALIIGAGFVATGPAMASPAPPTHYWMNGCHLTAVPSLKLRAGHALRSRILWDKAIHEHGFSECIFVSRKGTFVLLDIASSFMLSQFARHQLTAEQEFKNIDRVGGWPYQLQYVNRKRTQWLNSKVWDIGLRGDVLGLDTFGFFHRVHGQVPRFPLARKRLYIFLNQRVMPRYQPA